MQNILFHQIICYRFINLNHFYYRDKLHAGIIRDAERQAQRRFENLYILEKQRELTEKLEKEEQNSSHS